MQTVKQTVNSCQTDPVLSKFWSPAQKHGLLIKKPLDIIRPSERQTGVGNKGLFSIFLSRPIYNFSGSGKFILKNRDSCQTHGKRWRVWTLAPVWKKTTQNVKSFLKSLKVKCLNQVWYFCSCQKSKCQKAKKTQYGMMLLLFCCHLFLKHDTSGPQRKSRFEGRTVSGCGSTWFLLQQLI